MKKTYTIAFLFLISGISSAQSYFHALFPGDTIILNATNANGTIQWQMTEDTTTSWIDIPGATTNPFQAYIGTAAGPGYAFFRAKITNPAICFTPWYSSIIKCRIITASSQTQVGDFFGGGIVFENINGTLRIAQLIDIGDFTWGCMGTQTFATDTLNGALNTSMITSYCLTPPFAAGVCDTSNASGYSDWYLPSRFELNLMYENHWQIGNFNNGTQGYWSSTELSSNAAYLQFFSIGNITTNDKMYSYGVRCIRKVNPAPLPIIQLKEVNIGSSLVTALTLISSDGGSTITNSGVCWNTTPNPTTSGSKTNDNGTMNNMTSQIDGLLNGTTYYVRAYATNANGTVYSNQITIPNFTYSADITGQTTSVSDIDGNTYNAIGIGHQMWMTQNLKTSRLNDGTLIQQITSDAVWDIETSPSFCWYSNDSSTYNTDHGKLYNAYVIETNKICPTGWHVPSIGEWMTMINHLGGIFASDDKIKFSGSNSSGFSGRFSGVRNHVGVFEKFNQVGNWWSSSNASNNTWSGLYIWYGDSNCTQLGGGIDKTEGWSIRCIQD